MLKSASTNHLVDRQYVSLIVRLTLDQSGNMVQGEIVDTLDPSMKRFKGPSDLNQAVAAWLKAQQKES